MCPLGVAEHWLCERGQNRYTSAEFVSAESQVRNVSVSSQGPIVSVRAGMGRRL